MKIGPPPYFSGSDNNDFFPLERFLPPYNRGMLSSILDFQGIRNGWILDPIGSHPLAAIELAQAGYQVFVACNNPILARIYEVLCLAPGISDFQAVLSEFGALKMGEERLENQIKSHYQTTCPVCRSVVNQVTYLWDRDSKIPYKREIHCLSCGTEGGFELSDVDIANVLRTGNINLHRTRALQKVLPGFNEPPDAVNEVIESYLPRSLSVLTRLINKNDGFQTTDFRKKVLEALLILACDYGSMSWGIGSGKSRPKQVSIPNQFKEFNLWNILEDGQKQLSLLKQPVPLTYYPDQPPESGGICFYPSRIRHRDDLQQLPEFKVVATVLPRPNQAFWTYSAVWAGWLWGPDAANQLKGALERRRYDWLWHTFALRKLFEFTNEQKIPWIAVGPELTAGYTLSFLSAASSMGYELNNAALNYEQKTVQFYWTISEKIKETDNNNLKECIKEYLIFKGESANYQELFTIFLIQSSYANKLPLSKKDIDNSIYSRIQKDYENILNDEKLIIKIDKDQLENGEFWLSNPPIVYRPLADQTELAFIRYLQTDPIVSLNEIKSIVNTQQPGLFPISDEYLNKLLESYCDPIPGLEDSWQLRLQETVTIRQADIRLIKSLLVSLGKQLKINVTNDQTIIWQSGELTKPFRFFVTASCILSRFYDDKFNSDEIETVIIYPGSRAELLNYKLKHSSVLKEKVSKVHFVKYRHLRQMSKNPDLNISTWMQLLDADPAIWQSYNQPVLFK